MARDSYYYSFAEKDTGMNLSEDIRRYDNEPRIGEIVSCNGGLYQVIDVHYTSEFKDYDDHGSTDYYYYTVTVKRLYLSEEERQRIGNVALTMSATGELIKEGIKEGRNTYMDISCGKLSLYDNTFRWIDGIDLKALMEKLCVCSKDELVDRLQHCFEHMSDVEDFKRRIIINKGCIPYTADSITYSFDGGTWIVPEGVTIINSDFFKDRDKRNLVYRLYSKIGIKTYREIKHCKEVVLPSSLRVIDRYTFKSCKALEKVHFSKVSIYQKLIGRKVKVERIGDYAFCDCSNLIEIVLPNGLKEIGEKAFSGCSNLKNIVIPNSVTDIKSGAFYGCKDLESVILPQTLKSIGKEAFSGCANLKNIVIPNSVTDIESGAFGYCANLQAITIPDSVTHIGRNAFEKCQNLSLQIGKNAYERVKFNLRVEAGLKIGIMENGKYKFLPKEEMRTFL